MKKGLNFMFDFAVLCALLGVGAWMLADGNWVFGTLMSAAAVWQGVKLIKGMSNDDGV